MSEAKTLFDEGKLGAAIEKLTGEVKVSPANTGLRTFLFELLCFSGDWDRAERQLDVIGHQSASAKIGVEAYRNNIKAERHRRNFFVNGVKPHFLKEPSPYVETLVSAIKELNHGNYDRVEELLGRVEEERPRVSGRIGGSAFIDFGDCEDLIAPVLELFVLDKYTWLPFEQIKQIEILPPRSLRELLWANARIETIDGAAAEVFIPVLYSGSCEHPNDEVKLGRRTEWTSYGNELNRAAGSRIFFIDDEDKHIFDSHTIEFDHA
ncbi:MAG TPA: type VI secretion system accessory protein TagJ [Pyrinomonadaceae bacterium]|nr:type VI secretion system accessory protein TagJ [Pyrinomonadaceae bacterium]